jgi:N utilization substance protein A
VQRVEPKGVYVELGRTEGILEPSDFMPGEEYHLDDHIKVYVLEVNRTGREMLRGPQVRVSRIHPKLVQRLFEMEVPEIAGGQVVIKGIAREAGSRTKMAVWSNDENVDPIGACVGPKGQRVANIVDELRGEKIDIIKYSEDPAAFIAAALAPADVVDVWMADEGKACRVIVPDDQLSLAIGKEGQNAHLAARLTGYKIDIKPQSYQDPDDVVIVESVEE